MSQRIFAWRGRQSGNDASTCASADLDGFDVTEVHWSKRLEAFTARDGDEPLHLSDAGGLDGLWLAFLDWSAVESLETPLAVMLDYARYYGLRTCAIRAPADADPAPRPESFAFDAIFATAAAAEGLAEAWRAEGLDMERAPPVARLPEDSAQLRNALGSIPPVSRLVSLEGSRLIPEPMIEDCRAAGVEIRRLQWSEADRALIGGADDTASVGGGDLSGQWAVLSLASCRDGAETMEIVDEARGLGLKIVILVGEAVLCGEYGRLPLQGVDIAIFPRQERLDAALADAFRLDEKTALLRDRWDIAGDAPALLARVRARLPRLNSSGRLRPPGAIHILPDSGLSPQFLAEVETLGVPTKRIYGDGRRANGFSFPSREIRRPNWISKPPRLRG